MLFQRSAPKSLYTYFHIVYETANIVGLLGDIMKFTWTGNWKNGRLSIEADSIDDLEQILGDLHVEKEEGKSIISSKNGILHVDIPKISGDLGCSAAIREILKSDWGKIEPRTMNELREVMTHNAIPNSKGAVAGTLNYLTRSGAVKRRKKNRVWAYILEEGK